MNIVYHKRAMKLQAKWFDVLQSMLGGRVVSPAKPANADIAFIWSWRHPELIKHYTRAGIKLVYVDAGIIDRNNVLLSVDGFQNRGKFLSPQYEKPTPELKPWVDRDGPVLVAGQHPWDTELLGEDVNEWAERMCRLYPNYLFRPHPLSRNKPQPRVKRSNLPLERCFEESRGVITYSSNIAVESVIEGLPTITMDYGSHAWPVTTHSPGEWIKPDREEWLQKMVWREWTEEELSNPNCVWYEWLLEQL